MAGASYTTTFFDIDAVHWSITLPSIKQLLFVLFGIALQAPFNGACQESAPVAAGKTTRPLIFLDGALGAGSGTFRQLQIRVVVARHHEISAGYSAISRESDAVPADFSSGNIFGGNELPRKSFRGLGLSYGYLLPLVYSDRGELLRVVLRGGGIIGSLSEPGNFRPRTTIFGPSHDYDNVSTPGLAFSVQPGLVCTPTRWLGFGIGMFANFHKDIQAIGVCGNLAIGLVADAGR